MNTYKAVVTIQGKLRHTTFIGAKSPEKARKQLEAEGFVIEALWVLQLAA